MQTKRKAILNELSKYKMIPAMKTFTNALCTTNKVKRTYFLTWLKLILNLTQTEKQNSLHESFTNPEQEDIEYEVNSNKQDNNPLCSSYIRRGRWRANCKHWVAGFWAANSTRGYFAVYRNKQNVSHNRLTNGSKWQCRKFKPKMKFPFKWKTKDLI